MSKDINIDLKSINLKPLIKKYTKVLGKHAIFAAIFAVLVAYLFMVFKINSLSNAEPSPDQQGDITASIPKIDKNAVNQIQSLEQNNASIHSLFETARNNPFQE
jgi:hypothetical protein